jgi:Tfp pilus assembly protein PilF
VRALERAVAARAPGERALWPRFHLAEAYLASGAADRSERLAGELVAEDAGFYYGWHLRARALESLGRSADAAGAYRRALALRPTNRWLESRIAELDARARALGSTS